MTQLVKRETDKWQLLTELVINSVNSPASKRAYGAAISEFLSWYQSKPRAPFSKAIVQEFKQLLIDRGLSASSCNIRLSAIRKLAAEAVDNGLMPWELAAGISRVKGVKGAGVRIGNWLSKPQAERLIDTPPRNTLRGKRDRAILGVMIGAGLRRNEIADLCVFHLQQREGRWLIADLSGKGNKVRSVPIAGWTKALIDVWLQAAGISDGYIFRTLSRGGFITRNCVDGQTIFSVVTHWSRKCGLKVAAHDLRRTFAKLAWKGGASIDQVSLALGHSSIQTTQVYLGIDLDLSDSAADHLGLRVKI